MIEFTVYGIAQPRGSKQAVLIPKRGGGWVEKNGRPITAARDDNPRSKDWMASVAQAAAEAYRGELLDGPIFLTVSFFFPRPKNHFRTGKLSGVLKDSAPQHHDKTPDVDKLLRAMGDSLTGVIWRDDKQVAIVHASKWWTSEQACARVCVTTIGELREESMRVKKQPNLFPRERT